MSFFRDMCEFIAREPTPEEIRQANREAWMWGCAVWGVLLLIIAALVSVGVVIGRLY